MKYGFSPVLFWGSHADVQYNSTLECIVLHIFVCKLICLHATHTTEKSLLHEVVWLNGLVGHS